MFANPEDSFSRVQAGLHFCCLQTQKTAFLMSRPVCTFVVHKPRRQLFSCPGPYLPKTVYNATVDIEGVQGVCSNPPV